MALSLAVLTTLLYGAGWPRLAMAQESPSPIPEFTGASVYVSGVTDEYDPLRADITRLEQSSPQTYYIAVVRSTGTGRRSTRTYLERMVEQWEAQARQRGITFDRKRSVIVLLGIENHQIIVLGGDDLQERLGFRDPYIERDLLKPHFYQYARSNDYLRGLRVLVSQIDRWITDHDQELARHREEAVAREARLKGDAQSALDGAKRVLEETRKELVARKAAGLEVGALEARLGKAGADLDAAGRRIDVSASEALDLAQQSQGEIQGVVDRLRDLSALQASTDEALIEAARLSGEVLKAVEQGGREGLPVAPVQAKLDAANAQIAQARQVLKSDPEKARTLTVQADRGLRDALEHAKQLPELRRQVEQKTQAVAELERSAKAELDRVRAAGAAGTDLQTGWERASHALAAARGSAGSDDRQALASFDEAQAALTTLREEARGRVSQHRFRTRTLPLMLFGIIALSVLSVLGLLWLRKRRLRRRFDEQFKGFREKAVALMDKLDALRQRHKTLQVTDPDYTHPLTGATLDLYGGVEKDLNGLWDRWLRVMEVWDQAQQLVRAGSGLAITKTEEAKKLLEQEGDFEELLHQCASCEERLDRLNQGHEKARDSLEAAREEAEKFRKRVEEVSKAGLPTDPYIKELVIVEGFFAQAEGLFQADPIGASEVIVHSSEALRAVAERTDQVLTRFEEAKAVLATTDEVAARAAQLRSQGVHLTEEQANPEPRLDQARRQQAAAMEALRKADPASAAQRIDEARSLTEQAREGIDRHLRARDAVRKELPARRDEHNALRQGIDRTASILEELGRGFAPESWGDVAGNLDQARSLLQAIEARLGQATEAASDPTQHYLRAASTLAEVARAQARASQLVRAVAERQSALADLARQSRELAGGLESEIRQAGNFFHENEHAIGPEARRSLERTEQAHRDLAGLLGQKRPNWPEIRRRIDVVRQGTAVALRQGREDVEGFRRVTEKVTRVKQKAQEVGSLLGQESKDRPPANNRYRAAVRDLAQFERGGDPGEDWDRLLSRLDEIDGNLDRAAALAHEDISLANGAIAEITEADRVIRASRAYYESGVTIDVSEAEALLARARGSLATQAYEQAIEQANAAEQAAHNAHEQAAHDALRRRWQAERERVFTGPDAAAVIAAAQAAAEAAGRWVGSGGFSGFPMPSSLPSFPDTDVSAGSWGSGSDSGSWTSGADEGAW